MLTWLSDCTIGILEAYVADKMIFKKPLQHFNKYKSQVRKKKKKKSSRKNKTNKKEKLKISYHFLAIQTQTNKEK